MLGKLILSYPHFINTSFFVFDRRKTTKHSVRITQIWPHQDHPQPRQQCIIFLFSSVWPLFFGTSCSSSEMHDVFWPNIFSFSVLLFDCIHTGCECFDLCSSLRTSPVCLWAQLQVRLQSVAVLVVEIRSSFHFNTVTVCEQHEKLQLLHHHNKSYLWEEIVSFLSSTFCSYLRHSCATLGSKIQP